jgi:hypothetical protein
MRSALRLPARLSFVKELPHEQASTGAGEAGPLRLDSAIATGSHVIALRARADVVLTSRDDTERLRRILGRNTFAGASGLLWFWNGGRRFGKRLI